MTPKLRKLSKTDFLIWRECAHNAWLKVHAPEVYRAKSISAFDQGLLDAGNEVDVLARELFPGGIDIARGDTDTTAGAIAARRPVLYQPVIETEQLTIACDILVWNEATQQYDLYEVKASTAGDDKRAKDELYTYDVAFQAEVMRQTGVPLGRLNVVRLNPAYVRGEALDTRQLFAIDDFTERAEAIRDRIALEIDTAYETMQRTEPLPAPCACITKGRGSHCTTFAHTNPGVPEYSVHDIARIRPGKLATLVEMGVLAIGDVPEDFELSDRQEAQVRAARTGRATIDADEIAAFVAALHFPLAFLDYETFPAAIPRFAGYAPYHHVPFQFSVDVIERPGADIQHHEFLHMEATCPDEALIEALRRALPAAGSIVTWNQSFEMGVNARLAERNPAAAAFLTDVDVRIVDLMDVFSQQSYIHPGFRGRTSIKAVLPVLVPRLSYKALAIQEGATATAKWNDAVTGKVDAAEAAKIGADLLQYCGLDTLAMVEIWRVLVGKGGGKWAAADAA